MRKFAFHPTVLRVAEKSLQRSLDLFSLRGKNLYFLHALKVLVENWIWNRSKINEWQIHNIPKKCMVGCGGWFWPLWLYFWQIALQSPRNVPHCVRHELQGISHMMPFHIGNQKKRTTLSSQLGIFLTTAKWSAKILCYTIPNNNQEYFPGMSNFAKDGLWRDIK